MKRLVELGFKIVATRGTAEAIQNANLPCDTINKVREGRPHGVDAILNDEIQIVINTTGGLAQPDSYSLRRTTPRAQDPVLHDGFGGARRRPRHRIGPRG